MNDRDPDRTDAPDSPTSDDPASESPTPEAPASDAPPPTPPAAPAPLPAAHGGPPAPLPSQVPREITTIGVLCLVDGIINLFWGLGALFGLAIFGVSTACFGCFLFPLGLYPLVLGVLAIVYGMKLLSTPPRAEAPARWLAVLQIVNVLWANPVSVVVGIVNLVLFSDPGVVAFFDRQAARQRA